MGAYLRNDSAVRHDIDRIYEMFPVLRARQKINAANLSGGEQQMLVMGRALLLNPGLVLLDEPSLGLEPRFADLVFANTSGTWATWRQPASSPVARCAEPRSPWPR